MNLLFKFFLDDLLICLAIIATTVIIFLFLWACSGLILIGADHRGILMFGLYTLSNDKTMMWHEKIIAILGF